MKKPLDALQTTNELVFHGGCFRAAKPDECIPWDAHGDCEDAIKAAGFLYLGQTVGDPNGISYTVRKNERRNNHEWLIDLTIDYESCQIHCYGWVDLIECMNKLSPIAMAAIVGSDDIEVARELMRPTSEQLARDAKRQRDAAKAIQKS